MAFIISSLPLSAQAGQLQQYLTGLSHELSATAAENVCRVLGLHKAGESKPFGRKLVAALAAHGVVIKYSSALEALSRMCGQANWMRTLQASLPFDDEQPPAPVLYALQAARYGDVYVQFEGHRTLSDVADRLLMLVAAEWPANVVASRSILGIGPQMMVLELEHPTAPWLRFHICRLEGSPEGGVLTNLPTPDTVAFCERMTRALEYTYPGNLMFNSLRSTTLPADHFFSPEIHRLATGDKVICTSDLDFLPRLDGLRPTSTVTLSNGLLSFDSEHGPIEITPAWTTADDPRRLPGEVSPAAFNSLLTRIDRLRRITGGNLSEHFARVVTGAVGPLAVDDHTIIDTSTLEAAMDEAKLTPKDLALLTGLHQNVIQRVLKYGYAHETVIPKLAEAVGMAHPNAMLPSRKSDGIGMRIEDGASFLKALRKTHMWRRIIGESLAGDEAQEVGRICEALQEYVELADFRIDPANISPPEYAEMAAEPIDEGQLAGYIQELLDELKEMDIAVVVTTGIRYARMSGDLAAMDGTPLHEATLFFERVSALRTPGSTAAAA